MHRIVSMRADRASGSGGRNPVHAVKAANFLDQINLAFQIDAKGWHSDGASLRASFAEDLKAQAVQISDVLRGGDVRPEHLGSLLMAERDRARLDWPRISVHDSVGQLPASAMARRGSAMTSIESVSVRRCPSIVVNNSPFCPRRTIIVAQASAPALSNW